MTNEELIAEFRSGNRAALVQLVTQNEGLIGKAWQRNQWGLEHDDVLQIGRLALLEAAETWQPGRGTKFSTYAYTAIGWALKRAGESVNRARGRNWKGEHRVFIYRLDARPDSSESDIATYHDLTPCPGPRPDDVAMARIQLQGIDPRAVKKALNRV